MGLLDLFAGRRQLIVYRFFFEPGVAGWPESGCRGCSFMADQVAHLAHLNARDTTLAYVSRAPQADIERWKARMGWDIPWYTITDDFDADFGVDEWHGTNAFYRDDDGRIFRTYFINARGDEALGTAWAYLDMTALGRQEDWEDSPEGYPQTAALRVVEPPRRVRQRDRLRGRALRGRRLAARLEVALVMVTRARRGRAGGGAGPDAGRHRHRAAASRAPGSCCACDAWVSAAAGRPLSHTECSMRQRTVRDERRDRRDEGPRQGGRR